jgi:hypothetical protein
MAVMADTDTHAFRIVAGGELYLRKAPDAQRWQITLFDRQLNPQAALMQRLLLSETLKDHPILHQTFATPDKAAKAIRKIVA